MGMLPPEKVSEQIMHGSLRNHRVGMLTPEIISAEVANRALWAEFQRRRRLDRMQRKKKSEFDNVRHILKEVRNERHHPSKESDAIALTTESPAAESADTETQVIAETGGGPTNIESFAGAPEAAGIQLEHESANQEPGSPSKSPGSPPRSPGSPSSPSKSPHRRSGGCRPLNSRFKNRKARRSRRHWEEPQSESPPRPRKPRPPRQTRSLSPTRDSVNTRSTHRSTTSWSATKFENPRGKPLPLRWRDDVVGDRWADRLRKESPRVGAGMTWQESKSSVLDVSQQKEVDWDGSVEESLCETKFHEKQSPQFQEKHSLLAPAAQPRYGSPRRTYKKGVLTARSSFINLWNTDTNCPTAFGYGESLAVSGPTPAQAAPAQAAPTQAAPAQATPTQPAPEQPAPAEPAAAQSAPSVG